ncbi:MAG: hypothetical protein KTR30_38665 [Saprospiraceae bacterium]|nr:hypothetical protein [Saprospiraceae bacterium]
MILTHLQLSRGVATLLFCLTIFTATSGQTPISAGELQKDWKILKEALTELHPALHKYNTPEQMESHFNWLKEQLSEDQDLETAYAHISQFAAKVQCGHTYGNFWNQGPALQAVFKDKADKVPFTFRILNGKMILYQNLSEQKELAAGDEIVSINGHSGASIMESLYPYMKSDGANDGQRLFRMQVFGSNNYEAFDIYFPLAFELDNSIELQLKAYGSEAEKTATVQLITRQERFDRLQERYGKQIESYDDYWKFEVLSPKVAKLTIGTFVTWRMTLKWRAFLKNAFQTLKEQGIANLILDIRGNGGGDSAVQEELYKYLTFKESRRGPYQQTLRNNRVPEHLRPYLGSWSKDYLDVSNKTKPLEEGFYTFKKGGLIDQKMSPKSKAYPGKVYLIADASNSSGTFFLTHYLKANGLATIVGQTSGGNQQGITGGQIVYLTLPHSKVEVDIPLIGYYPTSPKPNAGIEPDIYIAPTIEALVQGRDLEVEHILQLIDSSTATN